MTTLNTSFLYITRFIAFPLISNARHVAEKYGSAWILFLLPIRVSINMNVTADGLDITQHNMRVFGIRSGAS